jgi:hypothetical protein
MRDPDFVEARCTISILQTALDRATARLRELETINAALNVRLNMANDRHDELESTLWRLETMS